MENKKLSETNTQSVHFERIIRVLQNTPVYLGHISKALNRANFTNRNRKMNETL